MTDLQIVNDPETGATATIVWGLPGSGKLNTLLEQVLQVAHNVPVIFCTNEVPTGQIRQRIGKDVPFEIVEVQTANDIYDCITRTPRGGWVFVDSVTNLFVDNVTNLVTSPSVSAILPVMVWLTNTAQAQGVTLWVSAQKRAIRNPVNAPISGIGSDLDTPS